MELSLPDLQAKRTLYEPILQDLHARRLLISLRSRNFKTRWSPMSMEHFNQGSHIWVPGSGFYQRTGGIVSCVAQHLVVFNNCAINRTRRVLMALE